MTTPNAILTAIIGMAQTTSPYCTVSVGSLPADNGICMTYSSGIVGTTFLTKGICYELNIVCNGKHTNQLTVSDALFAIHAALTQTKVYPKTSDYQITDISTVSMPSYLDREQNSQWLYGSSLRVKVFIF